MLGFVFAILSAFNFSLNSIALRRGVVRSSPAHALYITVIMGVPLFAVAVLVTGQFNDLSRFSSNAYLMLAASGIIHFSFGRYCAIRGMRAIGATRMLMVLSTGVPFSVLVAVLFLGERVSLLMAVGIFLIVVGPAIIVERPGGLKPGTPDSSNGNTSGERQPGKIFTLNQVEGYFFGLLGAIAYGTSPILISAALGDTGLSLLGGFVAYTAASIALVFLLLIPGRIDALRGLDRRDGNLFLMATLTIFLAQMFRFIALGIAPVSIVIPLIRTGAIFTLILSYIFNREMEVFGVRLVLAVFLSVVGAVLLAF
jgi:drug/metabolite transporter (DMT)-like permease